MVARRGNRVWETTRRDIGYQSLSQFNRSFARFTGNSPTNFRREELSKLAAS